MNDLWLNWKTAVFETFPELYHDSTRNELGGKFEPPFYETLWNT